MGIRASLLKELTRTRRDVLRSLWTDGVESSEYIEARDRYSDLFRYLNRLPPLPRTVFSSPTLWPTPRTRNQDP